MKTAHTVIHGESRQMSLIPDQSVHLVITSPPYWQLKDYGTEEQIGFHESYINHLNLVWAECFRVLHNGCRLCINIGDQFARSVYYGRYKVIPIHSEIIKFCETIGFDFMGQIIWQKATTMNTTGGGAVMGSFPYPRNGIVKLDFEYILLFKKQGNAPKPTPEQKANAAMTNEEWNMYFNGHWYFNGAKQDRHLAMLPEEWDRLFNVDFYIKIEDKYIGLQIKPINTGIQLPEIFKEYSLQAETHKKFTEVFGRKVFYLFSAKKNDKKEIMNKEVIDEIKIEIIRLHQSEH